MSKSADDWFAEANELFVDEQYEKATNAYDKAIEIDGSKYAFYAARAANHIKMENFLDAIPDCEKSLELEPNQHKAWERKGAAYFEMDEFESALECFEKAKKMGNKKCDLSIRKCRVELKRDIPDEDPKPDEDNDEDPKPDEEVKPQDDDKDNDEDEDRSKPSIQDPFYPRRNLDDEDEKEVAQPKKPKVKIDWCQSDKLITLTLFIKGMKTEDVDIKCESKKIICNMTLPDGEKWDKEWFLWGTIKNKKMRMSVNKVKVEVVVPKKKRADWESLQDKEHETEEESVQRRGNVFTEAIHQKDKRTVQYWNDLDKEMFKEEDEEKVPGQDALDKLFKQIYRDATPEKRRAMMKSYQTSGGTVLSTDWGEVSKTDYEKNISPPDGMEVRHAKDDF